MVSSLNPEYACEFSPTFTRTPWHLSWNRGVHGFKLHWRTDNTYVHFRLERTLIGGPINHGHMPMSWVMGGPGTPVHSWYEGNQNHGMVDQLIIDWPDGSRSVLTDVETSQTISVQQ